MGLEVKPGNNIIGWYVYRFKTSGRGEREDVLEWCNKLVKGRWSQVLPGASPYHAFYIEDKNDALLFKLTWFTDKPVFNP